MGSSDPTGSIAPVTDASRGVQEKLSALDPEGVVAPSGSSNGQHWAFD
jgi:hypothetical protein